MLLRLGTFPASSTESLERGVQTLPLQKYRVPGASADFKVTVHASRLSAQAVERVARRCSQGTSLHIRVERDVCTFSVDCAGDILHKRGYRQETSHAPLRETLAAGILRLAGYDPKAPLWDPMCGSGTFLIEAAWLSLGRAPGTERDFAFKHWPSFDGSAWEKKVEAARNAERPSPQSVLLGTDLNAGALGVARRNARRAGVAPFLRLERKDLRAAEPARELLPGLLISNLPYGKRVGRGDSLEALYKDVGEALRARFSIWRWALLVPDDPALLRALNISTNGSSLLSNGGIHCRLLLSQPQP